MKLLVGVGLAIAARGAMLRALEHKFASDVAQLNAGTISPTAFFAPDNVAAILSAKPG